MDEPTRLSDAAVTGATVTAGGSGWGRFAPGTVLAGRFRTSPRSDAAAWARCTALTT